jgi:type I restriction enzyme S subunit
LEKLIAKKKAIKQGAMQELLGLGFDSAQSITPRKRLHGFSGDWEERKLGDCLLENPKYGINAAAIDYDLNYPTYLRITDINDNGNLITSGFKSVNHADSSSFYIEKGDIVFARTGASVGKSYIHDTKNGDFVYAGFLIRIKVNQKILNPSFLSHYVRTKTYWNWVQVMSMRSGQPGINGNEFASFQISFPPVKEQKAIAKILNDMDLEIGSLETKTEKYKSIKDGMMQELLTGKIRLV